MKVAAFLRGTLIAGAVAVLAQPLSAAELVGKVSDSNTGRPLPNATVKLDALGRTATSNRSGEFRLTDIPAGTYDVTVEYVGFATASQSVTVGEGSTEPKLFALESGTVEEVVVTGFRLAQATALQDKKSSNVIKESVTADDAGKLPDQNAAETLARVTGVSVTTDQGEGRYVTIRGIDASLNNVTLDNQIIGTPEGDTRRIALDTVPANLLSKLEVIKSVTPDMDGNAIGGTINIVTPSAFDDADGRFLNATAEYGYYDLNGENPYGGAVSFGQVFGAEEQWGIVLSASYSDREYNSQNLQGGDPWDEVEDDSGIFAPGEFVLRDYTIRRVRKGAVANLEFRPTDDVKLYFRNLYNRFEDTENQPETIADYQNGDLENLTPTSGTFTEGEGSRELQNRFEIQSILTSTLGGDFEFGDWTLGVSATYGEAEQDTPSDQGWAFEFTEPGPMSYDTSNRFFTVDTGAEFQDAANFEFDEHFRGGQLVEEELKIGQVDLRRDIVWGGRSGFVKVGAKLVDREKVSDQNLTVYDGFDGEDLILSDFSRPGQSDFYEKERRYPFGPQVDYRLVNDFFAANEGSFEISDSDTIAESLGVDYTITEEVTAGYVMGSLEVGRAVFIGGVRVERTESEFRAFDIQFVDGDIVGEPPQVIGEKNYTNWLPGLQMTFTARDDLLLRAAWTNTIGRPSYEQNAPFRIFETEDTGDVTDDGDPIFEGELTTGNPDLDPLESMNFDAAIEWYLQPAGILAAGIFYKDIENPIFTRVQELEEEFFEGRFYEELTLEQPQNAEKGEILGVELSYQQQFRMLPWPFDGLGVQVSYTYTDSEAQVFDRPDEVPFFLQSEHIGNVALFYERAGLELRLAYAYRSEYLDSLGDSAFNDLYVDTHGQLDFKASYDFTQNVGAFVQVQNITNEPLRYFSGDRSRLAENEFYSWNAMAGVSIRF